MAGDMAEKATRDVVTGPRRGGGKTTELDINDAPTFEDAETSINGVKLDRVKSRPQQHKQQHLLCPKPPLCRGSN